MVTDYACRRFETDKRRSHSSFAAIADGQVIEGPMDVVAMCHSVREPRREIYGVVRRRWPGARILQVLPGTFENAAEPNAADGVVISGHPENLIGRAFEVLGHSARTDEVFH